MLEYGRIFAEFCSDQKLRDEQQCRPGLNRSEDAFAAGPRINTFFFFKKDLIPFYCGKQAYCSFGRAT